MPRWDNLGLSSADDNLIVKTSYGGVAPGPMSSQPSSMLFIMWMRLLADALADMHVLCELLHPVWRA
jgi:hypothetical protein